MLLKRYLGEKVGNSHSSMKKGRGFRVICIVLGVTGGSSVNWAPAAGTCRALAIRAGHGVKGSNLVIISGSQMDAFAEDAFVRRIADIIGEGLPARRGMPHSALTKIAKHCISVARGYGFATERGIGNFTLNMVTVNPEFHKQEHIHAILENRAIPEAERLQRILSDVSDEDWEQAAAMVNPTLYWNKVLNTPDK